MTRPPLQKLFPAVLISLLQPFNKFRPDSIAYFLKQVFFSVMTLKSLLEASGARSMLLLIAGLPAFSVINTFLSIFLFQTSSGP